MSKSRNRGGFTIIEVVLVLAIAGLIFLMVFIALPALQRGQRNTQRKNDLSRFVTAVSQYQANNSNKTPFSGLLELWKVDDTNGNWHSWHGQTVPQDLQYAQQVVNFIDRYIIAGGDEGQFTDPAGVPYEFWYHGSIKQGGSSTVDGSGLIDQYVRPTGSDSQLAAIHAFTNAKCGVQEGVADYSSGSNDIALLMVLEGGSVACNDNQ